MPHPGLITFDAKDPDTEFPPIGQTSPPETAPNLLVLIIDDGGFASLPLLSAGWRDGGPGGW